MWRILQNNAGWDCIKTPTLREILRTPNLLQVEHIAFLVVLFQQVGCVWSKLKFRTVQQNPKSFPWTQDWGWTVYPHLIYGIWLFWFLETRFRPLIDRGDPLSMTRIKDLKERPTCWITLIVPSNVQFSHEGALLYVFEDNEAVIKMILKGRSPTMRHVSRTHRVALDWLFDRINLDSKIQIKYIDTKKPTRRHLNQRKFHTWRMEPSFVFVQH